MFKKKLENCLERWYLIEEISMYLFGKVCKSEGLLYENAWETEYLLSENDLKTVKESQDLTQDLIRNNRNLYHYIVLLRRMGKTRKKRLKSIQFILEDS